MKTLPTASAPVAAHIEAFTAANALTGLVEPDANANQDSENNKFSHSSSLLWGLNQLHCLRCRWPSLLPWH